MSDFFFIVWLLIIAMTTLVSSFQHHSRISTCCCCHIIKEHNTYRYIKNRYNYRQEQNVIGDERFIGLSTSALCNTVKEALMNDPDFEVFSRLLKQANLEDIESSIGEFKHITVIPSPLSLLSCVNILPQTTICASNPSLTNSCICVLYFFCFLS